VYKGFSKSDPGTTITAKASITSKDYINDGDYYFFSVPDFDIRFYVNTDEHGAYMKLVRYPYPLFKFLSYDVVFRKAINFVRYPFVIGEKWHQETDAGAQLGPIVIIKKLKADFEVVDSREVEYKGATMTAYHVRILMDQGDGGKISEENHLYVDGIGYFGGETEMHKVVLYNYQKVTTTVKP
jgi:hypothetical protein